jgi:hypothetical protein
MLSILGNLQVKVSFVLLTRGNLAFAGFICPTKGRKTVKYDIPLIFIEGECIRKTGIEENLTNLHRIKGKMQQK